MSGTPAREPYMALMKAMADELSMVVTLTSLEPSFHRRLMVRVIFSGLEAFAFNLKRRSLEAGQAKGIPFSKSELEKLSETRTKVKDDGTTERRRFFLKSQDNLEFALAIYSRVLHATPVPPLPTSDMAVGVEVRDRLTHPKTAGAFDITAAEGKALGRLGEWFKQAIKWFGEAELANIARIREESSASLKKAIAEISASRPKT